MSAFEGGMREYMDVKEAKLQDQRRAEVTQVWQTSMCCYSSSERRNSTSV